MRTNARCSTGACVSRCVACPLPAKMSGQRTLVANHAGQLAVLLVLQAVSWRLGPNRSCRYRWPAESCRSQPQWITGPRLMRPGESLVMQFFVPTGITAEQVEVFPRYLEQARPGPEFRPGGGLDWLEPLPREVLPLSFSGGTATSTYAPPSPRQLPARWRVGGENALPLLRRDRRRLVRACGSARLTVESEPTLACDGHSAGLPPAGRSISCRRSPVAEVPRLSPALRRRDHSGLARHAAADGGAARRYDAALQRVRQLMPDPDSTRSVRVEMRHDFDPGYTETFIRLGVNDHCGLNEANAGRGWECRSSPTSHRPPTAARRARRKAAR